MSLKREKSSYIKTAGRRFTGLDNHPPTHTYTYTHTHTHTHHTTRTHTHTCADTNTIQTVRTTTVKATELWG